MSLTRRAKLAPLKMTWDDCFHDERTALQVSIEILPLTAQQDHWRTEARLHRTAPSGSGLGARNTRVGPQLYGDFVCVW